MVSYLSYGLTKLLKKVDQTIDKEKEEIIIYGLEVLIYEVLMFCFVFLIAFIFNIEIYVLSSVLSYSLVRGFASGVHAKTRIICGSAYLFYIFFSTLISIYVFDKYIFNLSLVLYSFNMIFLLKYAPGDTLENPIKDIKKIKFKKAGAVFSLSLIFLLSYIIKEYNPVISNIIMLSSTIATLLTTPFAYKIFGCKKNKI